MKKRSRLQKKRDKRVEYLEDRHRKKRLDSHNRWELWVLAEKIQADMQRVLR